MAFQGIGQPRHPKTPKRARSRVGHEKRERFCCRGSSRAANIRPSRVYRLLPLGGSGTGNLHRSLHKSRAFREGKPGDSRIPTGVSRRGCQCSIDDAKLASYRSSGCEPGGLGSGQSGSLSKWTGKRGVVPAASARLRSLPLLRTCLLFFSFLFCVNEAIAVLLENRLGATGAGVGHARRSELSGQGILHISFFLFEIQEVDDDEFFAVYGEIHFGLGAVAGL